MLAPNNPAFLKIEAAAELAGLERSSAAADFCRMFYAHAPEDLSLIHI